MNHRLRSLLVGLGWGGGIASLALLSLFQKPVIGPFEVLLIFLLGVLGGLVLASPSTAIPISFLSIAIAAILSYIIFSIPAINGSLGSNLQADLLYTSSAVAVFRNFVFPPYILFSCLTGSLVGTYLAERWNIGM